jgi:hypothetical protein
MKSAAQKSLVFLLLLTLCLSCVPLAFAVTLEPYVLDQGFLNDHALSGLFAS